MRRWGILAMALLCAAANARQPEGDAATPPACSTRFVLPPPDPIYIVTVEVLPEAPVPTPDAEQMPSYDVNEWRQKLLAWSTGRRNPAAISLLNHLQAFGFVKLGEFNDQWELRVQTPAWREEQLRGFRGVVAVRLENPGT